MAGILTFKEKNEPDVLRFHSQEHESLFHSLSRYPDNNTTALHLKYIQDNSASIHFCFSGKFSNIFL